MDKKHIAAIAACSGPQPVQLARTRALLPFTAAERMRAHRQRRRDGLRCLTIELRDTEIAALIGKKAVARHDQEAIRNALYRHLDRTLDEMP